MDPQPYLRRRRGIEIAFFVGLTVVNAVGNSITAAMDMASMQVAFEPWEPWAWEATSGVLWLALIPLILAFDRRAPLERGRLRTSVPLHLLATVVVSVLHVVGMILLRDAVYATQGLEYDHRPWFVTFGYEYLKDVRSYALLLALVYLYRFVLRRWQGEAAFVPEGREDSPPSPVTDRFLVKKLGREFLVRVDDIDWIEAAGNYVTLHVGDRLYPLRETMAGIAQKLDGRRFARVHRSAIVNLDRVQQIEPFDTGDARAHLRTGATVPVSRRYRQALKERLA